MARNEVTKTFLFCGVVLGVVAAVGLWYVLNRPPKSLRESPPESASRASREPVLSDASPPQRLPTSDVREMPTKQAPTDPPVELATELASVPPVRSSQFRTHAMSATYVGSDACGECHTDEHQSFLRTAHSRSFREVDPLKEPPDHELTDPVSGRAYQLYREAGQYRHRETLQIAENQQLELADYACKYVVGSGAHALTYLVETAGGFLAESPATWYASLNGWALSPGFENYNTGFARPVYVDCLFCHTGRSESVGGNRSRVKVHISSIDCERCHGPGSLHVERQNAAPEAVSEIDLTIVNPRRLSRAQNEAICAQCHLDSVATADIRGRTFRDFRPGDFLEDYRVSYGLDVPSTAMKVVGHVEQLQLSNCYRGAVTLTCTTCHDAHNELPAEDRIEFYRAKCFACHDRQACGLPATARLKKSSEDNCVGCHMPASPTNAVHVPATHHRIGIHTENDVKDKPSGVAQLIPLGDVSHLPKLEQDRCLGLAYLDASMIARDPQSSEAYRVRARDMLEDVKSSGLKDPVVDAALAKIYQRENPPKSIVYAESALQSEDVTPDTRTEALFALSNAYLSLKQTQLAIQPLEQLVELRRQGGDWFLLGVCRLQAGDLEAALSAAQRAAEIRPDKPNFQALLAELYRQTGQNELADQHELRAKQLAGPKPALP